jgi:hypothetical protein
MKSTRLAAVGARCADHATCFYPQKVALTSPTSGGRSIDIVRLRTKSHGVCLFVCFSYCNYLKTRGIVINLLLEYVYLLSSYFCLCSFCN